MKTLLPILLFIFLEPARANVFQLGPSAFDPLSSQQTPAAATKPTLHGRVVDARTGEPIAKVKVIASGTDQNTTTDENGSFTLANLPVGQVDLYITTVTFGLVKRTITLKEGDNKDFEIALNEEAAALTEKVTIVDNPFETTEASAASEQRLNKRELQELSSVLVGDPIRAAQALPGATTNDDYRSEFAVRGAGFDRIGLYLDGILTENLVRGRRLSGYGFAVGNQCGHCGLSIIAERSLPL